MSECAKRDKTDRGNDGARFSRRAITARVARRGVLFGGRPSARPAMPLAGQSPRHSLRSRALRARSISGRLPILDRAGLVREPIRRAACTLKDVTLSARRIRICSGPAVNFGRDYKVLRML